MEQKHHSHHPSVTRPAASHAAKPSSSDSSDSPLAPRPSPPKAKRRWPFPHVALAAAALGVREIAANHAITWPAVALLAVALIADVLWLVTRGEGRGATGE
jgi:hypothetical protein